MNHKKQAIFLLFLFSLLVSGWVAVPDTAIKALSTEIISKTASIAATQVGHSPDGSLFLSDTAFSHNCTWKNLDWVSPGASDEEMILVCRYLMDIASLETGHYGELFRMQLSRWNLSHNFRYLLSHAESSF